MIFDVLSKKMGASGTRPFENDQALDWLDAFREQPTERMLISTLLDPCSSPDSDPEGVIAAAEVVAHLIGNPSAAPYEKLGELPKVKIDQEALPRLAAVAVDRVRESWLEESWAETDLYDEWNDQLDDLRSRLRPN